MKKASPSHKRENKGPTNRLFSRGTKQAPTLAAPLGAPMSECDYKIHNIYSTLIYIKIHSRMHPIELFKKKIHGRAYPRILPLAMKLNSAVYAQYERQRKRNVLQYLPLSKKLPPSHCLNIDLYPPPPPDNNRVCDHNALLACVPTRENFPLHHWSGYRLTWLRVNQARFHTMIPCTEGRRASKAG